MTDIDIAELRRVAEAATPGPWHQGAHYIGAGGEPHDPEAHVGQAALLQDAKHIAMFDPPTVLALIDRLEQAEASSRKLLQQAVESEHARKLAFEAKDRANAERARAEKLIEEVRAVVEPPKPLELGRSMMHSFDRMIGDLRCILSNHETTKTKTENGSKGNG